MPKKSTTSTKKSKQAKKSFSEQFEELESIVEAFENNQLDVDQSLEQFEAGLQLAEELKKNLEIVENTILKLKKKYQVDEVE